MGDVNALNRPELLDEVLAVRSALGLDAAATQDEVLVEVGKTTTDKIRDLTAELSRERVALTTLERIATAVGWSGRSDELPGEVELLVVLVNNLHAMTGVPLGAGGGALLERVQNRVSAAGTKIRTELGLMPVASEDRVLASIRMLRERPVGTETLTRSAAEVADEQRMRLAALDDLLQMGKRYEDRRSSGDLVYLADWVVRGRAAFEDDSVDEQQKCGSE